MKFRLDSIQLKRQRGTTTRFREIDRKEGEKCVCVWEGGKKRKAKGKEKQSKSKANCKVLCVDE